MNNSQFNNVEVVVVGAGVNALGVMRSLGREFNTMLVTPKDTLVNKTKFGKRYYVDSTTNEGIVDQLIELGQLLTKPCVLLLTEENTVTHVSHHRERLAEHYILDFPSHELVTALQSKSDFQELAERHDAPIPKAVFWTSEFNGKGLDTLDFPCVFKPLYQDSAYSKRFKKAYKAASIEEVNTLYKEISPVLPDMITQEWIEGEDSDIYFNIMYFDKNSQPISSFTGRKLRSWPRSIGGTASCVDAPEHHDELTRLTQSFAQQVGFTGIMGMEYKFDANRQAFYMIEPTVGRTDYQHEIATLSGTNLLAGICRHLLGRTNAEVLKAKQVSTSTMWFDEVADANSLAHGSPKFDELKVKKYGAVYRWNDLGPYLFVVRNRIKSRIKG
mgnify:CR=1 FL=1